MHLSNLKARVLSTRLITVPFLCLWLFTTHGGFGQTSHQIFEHLTTDHGLSSNKVEGILQDAEGFYWIATQNGLNRFDGTSFKIYRHHKGDNTSLTHNYCTSMVEDKEGDIWVATYKGISRWKRSTGKFQQIYLRHPTNNFELTNRIYNIAMDQNGDIWIAGSALWKYDVGQDSLLLFQRPASDSLPVRDYSLTTHFVFDPVNKGLWLNTSEGLVFFSTLTFTAADKFNNPKGWKIFHYASNVELALDKKNRLWFRDNATQQLAFFEPAANTMTVTPKKVLHGIKQIMADEKDRIWIFYWQVRAEILDPRTMVSDSSFFSREHPRSVISEQASYVFVDRQYNYWIGSGSGISIYNAANQYYRLHQFRDTEVMPTKDPLKINALAQTSAGEVWLGTNYGLYLYDLVTGEHQSYLLEGAIKNITTLCGLDDQLWIGMQHQLWCLDPVSKAVIHKIELTPGIFFIRKGSNKDLWIGQWYRGLYHLDLETLNLQHYKTSDDTLQSIRSNNLITGYVDNNFLWIGYNAGNGFSRLNVDEHTWIHYHPQAHDLSNSNAGTVTSISRDAPNQLWLGTHGSGIFRFDQLSGTFTNYDQDNGLSSNYINGIMTDASNNLWVSTADGLNFMGAGKPNIQALDIGISFPDNDFVANGIKTPDGTLFFFGRNEFVEIHPERYVSENEFPHIVLSSFRIFDEEYVLAPGLEKVDLNYRQNFFTLAFSGIKTHPLKEVHYAYKLEGFDHDWVFTSKTSASYTNVPEGDYAFLVKASNAQGLWSDVLYRLPIHVKPPFWRTWWFVSLSVVLLLSAAYAFYRYRIGQMKKIFAVRTKISRDLHDDIGASLSSINFYSSVAEKEIADSPSKAKELVRQINHNSRQIIENISDIVWANQVDQKEISSLSGRIKNYGYGLLSQNNIDCTYIIDEEAEKKLTNPEARRNVLLIIKEALNNIAKYSQASEAYVHVKIIDGQLDVLVRDNGRGFDETGVQMGNGLLNMKKRVSSLHGTSAITSVIEKGTQIHCRFPLPYISDR